MRAEDFMTSPVLTVPPEAPREAVAALLVSHGIASAPVVDHRGELVGMVCESDVLAAAATDTARDVMTDPIPTVGPDAELPVLVARLAEATGRALPVLQDGTLVGIVGRRDVLRRIAAGDLRDAPTTAAARADAGGTRGAVPAPVVVGVDGTDSSLAALRWAIDQVRWTLGPLGIPGPRVRAVLAHAHPDLQGSQADSRRRAEAVLAVAVESALDGPPVEVDRVVREGHPVVVLAHEAREASMLVLGTRDAGTAGPGPIAARLVGTVTCPVVVIPERVPARPGVGARR